MSTPGYIMFRRILVLNISIERQARRVCLVRLQGSLKYMCLKCISKTFELQLLQGRYNVKNILLNFYITEISLFPKYLQKCSHVHKSNHRLMLCKNRSSLAGTLYLELYLKMSSFANISQDTTNVEQLFSKAWAIRDPYQIVFLFCQILPNFKEQSRKATFV